MSGLTRQRPKRASADRGRRLGTALMLLLTFTTGMIDAVGYLGLGKVFAGNMTGNVVILGMAVTDSGHLPITGPALSLVCFASGAAIGGRALRAAAPGWSGKCTVLLGGVAAALAVAGAAAPAVGHPPRPWPGLAVSGLLALAMGAQAATARHIAVKDVTTVVVTSTMTGLAADSRWGARRAQPWVRRLSAIALISAGAGVGAWLLRWNTGWAVITAAVLTFAAALVGHRARCAGEPAPR
ncbi:MULTISPECIES: YoaK family protein [Streptomyces]|uniref:YoaK family protein n=1 Tax=Streptomyces cuspidosporus TaxID=66882 RepID=A0ABP5SIA6_9ACTN